MSKVKRLLRYELRRAAAYKFWFIGVFCVLAVIIAVLSVVYSKNHAAILNTADKEWTLHQYEQEVEEYREMLDTYSNQLTADEKFYINRQIEYYQFFIDTDTVAGDYFNAEDYMEKRKGSETFGGCIYLMEYSSFAFMALAVAGALWAFSVEIHTGAVKNILASPSDRKTIFAVKTVVSAGGVFALPLLEFIVLLIVGACAPRASFLIYSGGYKAVDGLHILAQMGIRNLILILCFYAVTLICSVNLKPLVSGLIPVIGYFALAFLAVTVAYKPKLVMIGVTGFDPLNFFPISGLQNYLGGFDVNFFIMAILHIATACLLIWLSGRIFKRKDF